MGRVELGIGGGQRRILMGTYVAVCNYLMLKFETRQVSLMEICALLSTILDVFFIEMQSVDGGRSPFSKWNCFTNLFYKKKMED